MYLGLTGAWTHDGGIIEDKVEVDNEILDVGNDYDPTTNYRFTAPKAGTYQFLINIDLTTVVTTINVRLRKNGSTYVWTSHGMTAVGIYTHFAALTLAQNDYIEFWSNSNDADIFGVRSFFMITGLG
jgi:hypothetical protein